MVWKLGVVLSFLLGSACAQAGPVVDAMLNSVTPGQIVTFSMKGAGINNEETLAGVFNWTAAAGNLSGQFKTFCIELTQDVWYGGTFHYDLVPVAEAGNPDEGVFGPGTQGPLGAVRADLLSELFAKHYGQIVDDRTAAAFQMDVWEIAYDGSRAPGALDLKSGNFTVSADTQTDALAQSWLNSLDGSGGRTSLLGLTSPTAQDQLTIDIIPEPATWVLGGIAITALFPVLRRQWRKA
jgi:hypothetical protein